ncbi:type III secretion system inner membrane ring lipoprotein SctJ [Noviherbaspirillum sp. Root189]|uniref:type III secretion system inner membrane ring lipoprotein SctJ n=1 Tax=Noviherbaspirillum sp. Root189 TaxID=1736487 RepID=UPI0009E9F276|nr:type III secretion inner membrane ring lipoprotein SctJ [Noviherbaspirillum sp. Root189]
MQARPRHPLATRITTRSRLMPTAVGRLSALLLLSLLCACGKVVDLQSGLKDADANEMVTVLNRHGVDAQKRTTKEGVALSVKDTDISRATEALNAAGLPRRNLSNLGQVFKKEGMISTPLEERVRYIHGLSSELEYTLQQFDHVISARVHVVLPERVAPGEPIQPSSAAVFIKYIPPLDEDMIVPRVRNLVASSIPGLSGEEGRSKVSVVLAASELTAPAVEWTTVGPFHVMADSAGGLIGTITSIIAVFALALLAMLFVILQLHPKTADWMRKRFGKVLPFKVDNETSNEQASQTAAQTAPKPSN